jgi:hypothetical protein
MRTTKGARDTSYDNTRRNDCNLDMSDGGDIQGGTAAVVSLKFLPSDYIPCRLLYASATEFYDWSMRETSNTAVTAACMPTMPSF